MNIIVVGLNHTTASVELRERVSLSDEDVSRVLTQLCATSTVLESVVLSTCNRTEIYAVVSSVRAGNDYLQTCFSRIAGQTTAQITPHLYSYHDSDAVFHIMNVATGLDSLVIGETQILGQVRHAFSRAMEEDASGLILNHLFRVAIQVGKRAQTETTIGQHPVSVSYAAVQLAKKIFGDLKEQRALVIGAGKMSELTIQHLLANGVTQLTVANRTFDRAQRLANQYKCEAIDWNLLEEAVCGSDIVISSTGAKGMIVSKAIVEDATQNRRGKPLILIDIAVPRDIDPSISGLKHVYLYDIDDLEGVIAANLAERERQGHAVRGMIAQAKEQFDVWLAEQKIVPVIRAIREKGKLIQSSVMSSLEHKLPNLTERELKLLHKHTMSIVNQLLRDPIRNMKEMTTSWSNYDDGRLFAELFGVEEEIEHCVGFETELPELTGIHNQPDGMQKSEENHREQVQYVKNGLLFQPALN